MEKICRKFQENQTLTNLQDMKNAGLNLYRLKNNEFCIMHEFKLPICPVIPIYEKNDKGEILCVGVGTY